jgi:hypothetical protein
MEQNLPSELVDIVLQSGSSMLSRERMSNLRDQIDYIITNNIQGCFVETGVAKGGSIIFMKKYLDQLHQQRTIHACDSFEGMPPASQEDVDHTGDHADNQDLSYVNISLDIFLKNLDSFNITQKDIVIHKGWFNATLKDIHEPIALLRMDSDWYDSTMTTFELLYDQVTPGGVILIDDYGWWQGCKKAVHDFFNKRNIPLDILTKTVGDITEVWFIKPMIKS